jgi:hypothetical protein
MGYTYNEKYQVWAENVVPLYEEAVARQWSATRDIPWDELKQLPEDIERAQCQIATLLTEIEMIASDFPAKWLWQMNQHFHEVKMFLCTQAMDEARHLEVFRKRALANGGGLLRCLTGTEMFLRTILHDNVAIAAAGTPLEKDLGVNPISFLLLTLRAKTLTANTLPTLANLLAALSKIEVTFQGTSVVDLSFADLGAAGQHLVRARPDMGRDGAAPARRAGAVRIHLWPDGPLARLYERLRRRHGGDPRLVRSPDTAVWRECLELLRAVPGAGSLSDAYAGGSTDRSLQGSACPGGTTRRERDRRRPGGARRTHVINPGAGQR